MDLAVVIACFNAGGDFRQQLDALSCQRWSGGWEVIVADNGSSDGSLELARSYEGRIPTLTLVDASATPGQCFARNLGARHAAARSLIFVDQDDIVAPGFIAAMGNALAQHEFVGARIDSVALNPGWIRDSRAGIQERGFSRGLGFMPFVLGAALGVDRAVFLAVGGFDENIPGGGEDVDLSWRLMLQGHEPYFVEDAVVHYRYRAKYSALFRQARESGCASALVYQRYRAHGMPRNSMGGVALAWARSVIELAGARSKGDLARLVSAVGGRLGRLQGSLKYRVVYL